MNKRKSQAVDIIVLLVAVCIIGFFSTMGYMILTGFDEELEGDYPVFSEATSGGKNSYALFDNLTIFLLIAGIIVLAATAYFIQSNPLGLIVFFIVCLLMILVVPFISNFYGGFATDSVVSPTTNILGMSFQVSQLFPIIIIVFIILIAIALFGKPLGGR